MADGSIVVDVALNDKQAQAELNRLEKKINGLQDRVRKLSSERLPWVDQARELGARLDAAKAKLAEMEAASVGIFSAESVTAQRELVKSLQGRWNEAIGKVEHYDTAIEQANEDINWNVERAGELSERLAGVTKEGENAGKGISAAAREAANRVDKLGKRIASLAKQVFVFALITKALSGVKAWFTDLILTNDSAAEAIGRLKGALLTLVQPLVGVIIPAFEKFVNFLTEIVNMVASIVAKLFGTTIEESSEAAENLYEEQQQIKGVGKAAKKAAGQLASFDEINKLSGESSSSSGSGSKTEPKFGDGKGGLFEQAFAGLEEKVTAALLVAGIALICIGAALLNLGLVIAGLLLLGYAIKYGKDSGTIGKWADALGLDSAEELITAALLVAGIAAVVIGIATGNVLLFLAGAAMIGAGLYYGKESGIFANWAEKLGLDSAEELITAALLVAGMAALVIGIIIGNIPLVLIGAGLIGAGLYYGGENGVLASWAEKLGLDSAFDYITTAIQIFGIAMIVIGACMGNIFMCVFGAIILGVGIASEQIGEEKLKEWWETLQLTTVQQWVGVIVMLAGIALIAIGVAMANIIMVIAGMALVGIATATNAAEGNLKNWVEVLGLEKVAGWVTAALLLGGIALIVIGIATANVPMVLAGLGLLGAGISVGITSGTFQTWLDTIADAFVKFKEKILDIWSQLWGGIADFINSILGGIEGMANGVVRGINKVLDAISSIKITIPDWIPELGGRSIGFNLGHLEEISLPRIPKLAEGAVIPPNREFLAVLGDQRTGTNVEAPLETIVAAFQQVIGQAGNHTIILQVDKHEFGRITYNAFNAESQRIGMNFGGAV